VETQESSLSQEEAEGKAGGWMVHAMYFSMGLQHDYREALKNVVAPVLVIHAANDFQSEAVSRLYVDAFPNSRFKIVEGATHVSFGELGIMVKQFLDEVGSQ
jgi:pimeloyl-ACP methyl ester carboxylesterase